MSKLDKIKENLSLTCANDILSREYNKQFERKVMLTLDIAHQRELDPEEFSSKKVLRRGSDGTPLSYQDIPRKEYIAIKEKELESVELVIKVIEGLFEE